MFTVSPRGGLGDSGGSGSSGGEGGGEGGGVGGRYGGVGDMGSGMAVCTPCATTADCPAGRSCWAATFCKDTVLCGDANDAECRVSAPPAAPPPPDTCAPDGAWACTDALRLDTASGCAAFAMCRGHVR